MLTDRQGNTREYYRAMDITRRLKGMGLPPGWDSLRLDECQCGHDHDAVVLCRRTVDDDDHGTEFVVWWVNLEMGGCFNGHYTDDEFEAVAMYEQRRRRLR